jgi:hypothetical protein
MIAITPLYSVCSLCGPRAKRCARYNAECAAPKKYMTSQTAYRRELHKWAESNELFEKRRRRAAAIAEAETNETKIKFFFEDKWMD